MAKEHYVEYTRRMAYLHLFLYGILVPIFLVSYLILSQPTFDDAVEMVWKPTSSQGYSDVVNIMHDGGLLVLFVAQLVCLPILSLYILRSNNHDDQIQLGVAQAQLWQYISIGTAILDLLYLAVFLRWTLLTRIFLVFQSFAIVFNQKVINELKKQRKN